jgi:3-methyladenine DNA glycosylase AlkD
VTIPELLEATRARLRDAVRPRTADGMRQFFREPIRPYGVAAPQVREIARLTYRELKSWPVAQRDRFMTALWKSGRLEEGSIVCYVYRRFAKSCGEREFAMFERWVDRYVKNWGHCDGVSTWLLAACIANDPALSERLSGWTKSKNRWKRRAAAVALVYEARRGRSTAMILRIAALLKQDSDDMVQKGLGWMLKETYPHKPREVIRFLEDWRADAPRLVLRLAAEKMTPQDRQWLLKG